MFTHNLPPISMSLCYLRDEWWKGKSVLQQTIMYTWNRNVVFLDSEDFNAALGIHKYIGKSRIVECIFYNDRYENLILQKMTMDWYHVYGVGNCHSTRRNKLLYSFKSIIQLTIVIIVAFQHYQHQLYHRLEKSSRYVFSDFQISHWSTSLKLLTTLSPAII
jgi:hypothetical protein